MKISVCILLIGLFLVSCSNSNQEKYIFYLHGQIIEQQGLDAHSDRFGKYAFEEIVDSLKEITPNVVADVRDSNVHFVQYCDKVSSQIDSLIQNGLDPSQITVIGASKGGLMAMYLSHSKTNAINYVLLGCNNLLVEQENEWKLNGRILAIYESSDLIAGRSYDHWIEQSPSAVEFKQIELNSGLGHGFLYRPIAGWLIPSAEWIK